MKHVGPPQPTLNDLLRACRPHIFILASVAALVFSSFYSESLLWQAAFWAGLDWSILNLLNKCGDIEEDLANGQSETSFVLKYRSRILISCGLMLFGTLILTWQQSLDLTLLRILFHLGGILYSFEVIFGLRRLKEYTGIKNLASALLFIISGFGYGIALRQGALIESSWAIFAFSLYFVIFEISYEIIYDWRDIAGDLQSGIETIPTKIGAARTFKLVAALQVASVFVLIGAQNILGFNPIFLIFSGGPLCVLGWIYLKRKDVSKTFCTSLTWFTAMLLLFFLGWKNLDDTQRWYDHLAVTEYASLVLIACYLFAQVNFAGWSTLRRFFLIAVIAWAGEQTTVSFYNFYHYSPQWTLLAGVPLVVPLIWTFLIETGQKIISCFTCSPLKAKALLFTLIVFDAFYVESIATSLGYWRWDVVGLFERFPLVGVLGWGLFAISLPEVSLMAGQRSVKGRLRQLFEPLVVLHSVLLVLWWGCFRWVHAEAASAIVLNGLALICAMGFSWVILRTPIKQSTIGFQNVMFRSAGAGIFILSIVLAQFNGTLELSCLSLVFVSLPYCTQIYRLMPRVVIK
jgi:4-hydroxybenzoate polyprenyltransferase